MKRYKVLLSNEYGKHERIIHGYSEEEVERELTTVYGYSFRHIISIIEIKD